MSNRTRIPGLSGGQEDPFYYWFMFLRLALKDDELTVDSDHYKDWGDIESVNFPDWWNLHWRKLFRDGMGVVTIDNGPTAHHSGNELIIRLPLDQDINKTIGQVKALLQKNVRVMLGKHPKKPKYILQCGNREKPTDPSIRFFKNLRKMRMYMDFYRFWVKHHNLSDKQRVERTSISYFRWATANNQRIRERFKTKSKDSTYGKSKKMKAPNNSTVYQPSEAELLIEIPPSLSEYVRYLDERGSRKKVLLHESAVGDVSDHRRQVVRYIIKSRNIAANVAIGVFPGEY